MACDVFFSRKRENSTPLEELALCVKTRRLERAPDFFGDPNLTQMVQEALQALKRVTQSTILLGNIQAKIDTGMEFADVMAEIGALHYLLTCRNINPTQCHSYLDFVLKSAETELARLEAKHRECTRGNSEIIACGRHSLIRMLFVNLMLPSHYKGISRAGLEAVRKLLGPNNITSILNVEHTHRILHTLGLLAEDASFFDHELTLNPSLYEFCMLDQKKRGVTPQDVKKWVLQMLFCDILQQKLEGNCYAIGALKFILAHDLKKFLGVVRNLLESGYYKIGSVEIEISPLMKNKRIRQARLDVQLIGNGKEHSVIARCFELAAAFFPQDSENISLCALFKGAPAAAHYYCSYFENLLQRIVLEYFHLLGVNGSHLYPDQFPNRKNLFIKSLTDLLAESDFDKEVISRILGKVIWLWDCNVEEKETWYEIEGVRFKGEGVERIVTYGRAILFIHNREVIRVATLSQFTKLIERYISNAACVDLSISPSSLAFALKRLKDPSIRLQLSKVFAFQIREEVSGLPDDLFERQDLCYLVQTGGQIERILNILKVLFRAVNLAPEGNYKVVKMVQSYLLEVEEGSCLLFTDNHHAFAAPGGLRLSDEVPLEWGRNSFLESTFPDCHVREVVSRHYSPLCAADKIKRVAGWRIKDFLASATTVFPREKAEQITAGLVEKVEKISALSLKLYKIYEHLGLDLTTAQNKEIKRLLPRDFGTRTPSEWSYIFSSALARTNVILLHPHDIEVAIRKAHSLHAICFLGNPNWTEHLKRSLLQWKLYGSHRHGEDAGVLCTVGPSFAQSKGICLFTNPYILLPTSLM
ncbi:MAG: hypothetical protein H7A36_05320 [Chlamydiales bacterium]|nr:hypothetical protein [Chlamydiales bacterium]